MTGAYFDSSAILKRYLQEPGAVQARRLMRRYETVCSILTPLETLSALVRRHAVGEVGKPTFDQAVSDLKSDAELWEFVELEETVLQRAEAVIARSALKTIDAVHVASALAVQERWSERVPFITADQRQAAAARSHGLEVIAL